MTPMYRSIVVGTDGSDTASEAVAQAIELSRALGARLLVVSAYEPVPGSRLRDEARNAPADVQWLVNPRKDVDATLAEAAARARQAGVEVDVFPRQGDPADAILDVAEEQGADLVVVGNKGMTEPSASYSAACRTRSATTRPAAC